MHFSFTHSHIIYYKGKKNWSLFNGARLFFIFALSSLNQIDVRVPQHKNIVKVIGKIAKAPNVNFCHQLGM